MAQPSSLLNGFRAGMELGQGIRAAKERKAERKDRKEFNDLKIKLEEERNALTKESLDNTKSYQEKSLAADVTRNNQIDERDRARIALEGKRVDNDGERLKMQGDELAARMREMDMREKLAKEQVTAMQYDNQMSERSLASYDDVTAAIAKTNLDLDALGNEETAISKLLQDSLTSNPAVAQTDNFKALTNRLRSVKAEQQAINEGSVLKRTMVQALMGSEKTAPLAVNLMKEWGQQAKGVTMSYSESTDPYLGTKVPSTRVSGSPQAVQQYLSSRPEGAPGTGMPTSDPLGASLSPQGKPAASPGQASAFSVLGVK